MLGAFHFLRPLWLLAFVPAAVLWWMHRRRSDTTLRWRAAIAPELLRHLVVPATGTAWLRPADALLAAWAIGILAIAGPTWERAPSPFAEDRPPVMIVLKVTPSMQERDLPPSRLARAQEKIADLLKLHAGQAAGLVAYAGSAHLVLPPTRDAGVVVDMARALAPDVMPDKGDDLGSALALARSVLAEGGQGGTILLLADGVAPDQLPRLRAMPRGGAPVTLLAMLAHGRAAGPALRQAAGAMDARLVAATVDTSDVASIGRSLLATSRAVMRPGEAERWRDMGWFLVPLLALVALLWFRRGWMVLR